MKRYRNYVFLLLLLYDGSNIQATNLLDTARLVKKESAVHFRKSSDFSALMGALKYANLGLQYQYNFQPSPIITLQGMVGMNFFNYNVYSASAKHSLPSCWIPISVGSRINVHRGKNYGIYAFGKYGWAIGRGGENHTVKSKPCSEYGVGSLISLSHNKKVLYKAEIGRQHYTFQGDGTSSFQSVINYDLKFSSYFFRAGLVFLME